MSDVQHTPGPWVFQEGNKERPSMSMVHKASDRGFPIAQVICETQNTKQRAEDIANARLIAAAPDLLAACHAARKTLIQFDITGDPAFDCIGEAIDKATRK